MPGDSVRILLLASGALALLPAATTDLARSNVQGALDKALFSQDKI